MMTNKKLKSRNCFILLSHRDQHEQYLSYKICFKMFFFLHDIQQNAFYIFQDCSIFVLQSRPGKG